MDTGNIMANQMSDQIENSENIKEQFDIWIYKAVEIVAKRYKKEPHDIFPKVNLTDAKLSFFDGMSAEEYSKEI